MNNYYYIFGDPFVWNYYGRRRTLLGAKRLANKNVEYWASFQNRRRPRIYKAEDIEFVDGFPIPKEGAKPIC